MDKILLRILITQNCNLKCNYCIDKDHLDYKKSNSMSKNTAKQTIDFITRIKGNKPLDVLFTGGEPLLAFDQIKYTINYCKESYPKREFQFKIITNGTLITQEIAEFLNKNQVFVFLSYDATPEKSTNIKGDLSKISDSILILNKHNVSYRMRMLVSSKHLNLIDYINKGLELKAPSISLHPIKGKNQDWDLEKTKKAFLKLADEFIESCKNENQLPIYSFTNPLNRYLDNKPPAKFKCSPGKNYFRVLANGTILACRMKEQPEDNIGTVFDKYIDIQRLIELRRYNYIEIDECKECEAKEICNLDLCPNRIFNLKNNIIKFPDTECIWTRAKHAGVNKIIRDFSQNQEFLKKAI